MSKSCLTIMTQRLRIFRGELARADHRHWQALQVLRRWRRRGIL